MILKLLVSAIFAGAAVQKFTGKVAPNWDRWGYSRQFMYATGIAELGRVGPVLVARARTRWCRDRLAWCSSAHWPR